MGHGGSIPPAVIRRWFNAVLIAETTEPESILGAYHALAPAAHTTPNARPGQATADPLSLRLADLLREYHLRQPKEG